MATAGRVVFAGEDVFSRRRNGTRGSAGGHRLVFQFGNLQER